MYIILIPQLGIMVNSWDKLWGPGTFPLLLPLCLWKEREKESRRSLNVVYFMFAKWFPDHIRDDCIDCLLSVHAKSLYSLCDPMDCNCQTPLSTGFFRVGCHALLQGILLTQGSNRLFLMSPSLAGCFFTTSTTWEAHLLITLNSSKSLYVLSHESLLQSLRDSVITPVL